MPYLLGQESGIKLQLTTLDLRNSEMRIQRVFLDIEGCIMPSGGRFKASNLEEMLYLREEIALLQREVCLVSVCSGRQAPYGEHVCQDLNLMHYGAWSVLENGAILYHAADGAYQLNTNLNNTNVQGVTELGGYLDAHVRKAGGVKELGKEYCRSYNPPGAMTIEDWYSELCGVVERECGTLGKLVTITHSRSAVDVTPSGVNKATAILQICHMLDIGIEEVAYVGDTAGDHPALEIVGLPMGPANASPETQALIRSRGGIVSEHPEALGTAELMRYIFEHCS